MGIHLFNLVVRNILVIKLSGFAEIFDFLTPAPVVSVLKGRHIALYLHKYDVILRSCMSSCAIMYDVVVQNNL